MMPKLGFIGIGLMGAPMTRRLLEAGYAVTIWNRSAAKLAPLVTAGAVAASSPAEVANGCDVLMLCVTDADTVAEVMFGSGGAAEGLRPGMVVVDFSSIRPEAARDYARRVAALGCAWVDAPVSGGVPGAERGTLAIMAGGEAAAIERVRPLMAAVSARFTHMGPSGAGQTTKLINQVFVGSLVATMAEAFRMAESAGVDAARIPDCLKGGFADSIPLQLFGPRIAARAWTPALAATSTLLKDLDTALSVARQAGSPLPMASTAAELLRMLVARGLGQTEPSALVDLLGG